VSEAGEDARRRLLRARDLMDRHYARPLDVDQLARVALMARSHFIREFRRVFAETPYHRDRRRGSDGLPGSLRDHGATGAHVVRDAVEPAC
jgi:AraC-like DNA-binding protein